MVNPLFQPLFQQGYHIAIGSCRYNDNKAINSPENVALIQSLMDPSFSASSRTSGSEYQTGTSGSRGGSYDSGYQDTGSFDFYGNTGAKGSASGTSVFNSFLDEAITGGSGSDMRTTSWFLGLTGRQMDSWGIKNNVGQNDRIELGNIIAGRGEYSDTGRTQGAYQLGGGSLQGMSFEEKLQTMQAEIMSMRESNAKLTETNNKLQTRDNIESAIQQLEAKGLSKDEIAKELGYGNKAGLDKAVKENPQEVASKLTENASKLDAAHPEAKVSETLAQNNVKDSEQSGQQNPTEQSDKPQDNVVSTETAGQPTGAGGDTVSSATPSGTGTEGNAASASGTGGDGGSGGSAGGGGATV